jgi:hypothetical protein
MSATDNEEELIKLPYILKTDSFRNDFEYVKTKTKSFIKNKRKQMSTKVYYKNVLFKRLPIVQWLFVDYNVRNNLQLDLFAGFTVGIMTLPQSMAYVYY